jgi:general secretion pathway protein K
MLTSKTVGPGFQPAAGLLPGEAPRESAAAARKGRPHTAGSQSPNRTRGGALLSVLWLSAALAAIAFSVSSTVRAETERVSTAADGLRAWYLAAGSVERGIQWTLWGPGYRNPDGSPRFWEPNLPRMYMSFPSGDAIVEMIPESSKLNVNFAPPDLLYRVVLSVTQDEARADEITTGILDWRSAGLAPTLGLGSTFQPRHASLEEIEELLLVRGITPELFYGSYAAAADGSLSARGGLRDCLSVWGSPSGPFDINAVSPVLMEALGVPPEGAAAIAAHRRTQPFRNLGDVAALGFPIPRLGVGGNSIWTLRGTARLRSPDGRPSEVVRSAAAVVKFVDQRTYATPVHILRWYDDAWSQEAVAPFSGMPAANGNARPGPVPGEVR